jgi:hypothetical protein
MGIIKEIREESKFTKMPFGKYRGYFIKDIPIGYLEWAKDQLSDEGLRWMCRIEYERRTLKNNVRRKDRKSK